MEEQIQHSDVLHGATNDVFQRILDLGPQLREFVTLAKQYHKALLGASVAANSFYQGFAKIARHGSDTRASNKLLGKGICDIIAVHKQIENQTNNVVKALGEEFIFPIEAWIEQQISQTKAKQKNYNQDTKLAMELVEKSRGDLIKVRKKSQRSKTSDKYDIKEQQIMSANEQYQKKLDELRVSGCHDAVRAERNTFSFIIEKINSISKIDVLQHEKAFNLLKSRLPIWDSLLKQPLSLDLNVSSLLLQITDNGRYGKSLDEHLSLISSLQTSSPPTTPLPPPTPLPPTSAQQTSKKRLSIQVPLGLSTIKKNNTAIAKDSREKLQAIFPHNAADSTQLTFEQGDVIKALTDANSGWQYGENTRTEKSGWFPVAFTEKVIGVQTSANPTHTMPASHTHHRPTVIPTVNGTDSVDNMPPIPYPDYGVPRKDSKIKENNNHVSIGDQNHSGSFNVAQSKVNSHSSHVDQSYIEMNNIDQYFPPPPPPPQLPILEEDTSLPAFPPPPAPPPPPITSGNYDQAM